MKTLFLLILLFSFYISIYSQETINPSCNSNVSAWTIEKITVTDNKTIVDLRFFTTDDNYYFWISSGMYIQENNNSYSKKYYIKEFVGNELDKTYKNPSNTTYYFTWIFESIPEGLTNISIMEPETSGNTAWYWKNITINNPVQSISNASPTEDDFLTVSKNDKLNTLVYFTKSGSEKVLIAKLVEGKVYYNKATTNENSNPVWQVLVNYDIFSSILDMNNVAIMSYDGDRFEGNNFGIINGFYSDGQKRHNIVTTGFRLINKQRALAQYCGGQKFVIEKAETGNLYYVKFPLNFYDESSYEDIKNTQSNLSFEIVNPKSIKNDFAIIFFLLKYAKSDTNPCE